MRMINVTNKLFFSKLGDKNVPAVTYPRFFNTPDSDFVKILTAGETKAKRLLRY